MPLARPSALPSERGERCRSVAVERSGAGLGGGSELAVACARGLMSSSFVSLLDRVLLRESALGSLVKFSSISFFEESMETRLLQTLVTRIHDRRTARSYE
jgi:hypothetical protein